jgi:hypothetical protein
MSPTLDSHLFELDYNCPFSPRADFCVPSAFDRLSQGVFSGAFNSCFVFPFTKDADA